MLFPIKENLVICLKKKKRKEGKKERMNEPIHFNLKFNCTVKENVKPRPARTPHLTKLTLHTGDQGSKRVQSAKPLLGRRKLRFSGPDLKQDSS